MNIDIKLSDEDVERIATAVAAKLPSAPAEAPAKAKAEPKQKAEAKKEETKVTSDDVMKALKDVRTKHDTPAAKALIEKYSTDGFNAVAEADLPKLLADAKAKLAEDKAAAPAEDDMF